MGNSFGRGHAWGQQSVCYHMHYCMGMPALLLCHNALTVVVLLQVTKKPALEKRHNAGKCYDRKKQNLRAATMHFSSMHLGAMENASALIEDQGRNLLALHPFCTRFCSEQHPKTSRAQAVQAARLRKACFLAGSTRQQFSNMQWAKRLSAQLRQIKQDADCKFRCLREATMQHQPDLMFSMQQM